MRRLLNPVVLMVSVVCGTLLLACRPAGNKPAPDTVATPDQGGKPGQIQPPAVPPGPPQVTPPAVNPPAADSLSSSGLPAAVVDALRKFMSRDASCALGRWLAVDGGYYLVEMHTSPMEEHLYLWISSNGEATDVFLGVAENGTYADYSDGQVRILCNRIGDVYAAFPYYQIARPGGKPEEAAFFKTANANSYVASSPGMAYELRKVTSTSGSLDLLFMITGPGPDGTMAGGSRPPVTRIIESPGSVTVRLWHVTLAPGTEEVIRAFSSDSAKLDGVSWSNGCLEMKFSVPWKYGITFVGEKVDQKPGDLSPSLHGYRISFLSKEQDAQTTSMTLHQGVAAIAGIRLGDVDVTGLRLVGELQTYLLRAFPAKAEPAAAKTAADVALLIAGQWKTERQAYAAGEEGKPSYVKWQNRWYELEPGFDALLKTARIADRDMTGATPDDVVKRYLRAIFFKDWTEAYECLGLVPEDVSLSRYVEEMSRVRDRYVDALIVGYSIKAENSAAVYVTYTYRWSDGTERTFAKEPWACIKENGVWKVRWLPRQ
jgi:hypothetical protein